MTRPWLLRIGLVMGLVSGLLGCGEADEGGAQPGVSSGGTMGNGGSTTGSGGSTTGNGGSTTGSGGSTTGSGGSTTGNGGSTTGNGGSTTGNGGATTGEGGAVTGEGGAVTGEGGAVTGEGGTTSTPGLPWLHTDGNLLKDEANNTVVLRGVALVDLGSTEQYEGGLTEMVDRLTDKSDTQGGVTGWYPRVLRLAVYPYDSDVQSPIAYQNGSTDYYDNLLRPIVDYCKEKGVYAIIDWHYIDDTSLHRETTAAFWRDMAPRFANDSHVIFELYNEPINDAEWSNLRGDMQEFYDIARAGAPNNLILIGTPNWCQNVGDATEDPLDAENVAYVAHMYPMHWGYQGLRDQLSSAAARFPVFVTEWGFEEDRDPVVDGTVTSYGTPFRAFVDELGVSWTAWAASGSWFPAIFNADLSLSSGESRMGVLLKTWLYDQRNNDLPAGM